MTDYQRYANYKWQTESGKTVRWSEMTPTHLRNAAVFLRTAIDDQLDAAWNAYCHVQGEFAEYAIDSAISSLENQREEVFQCAEDLEAYAGWREQHDAAQLTKLGQLLERTTHAQR